MPPGDVLDLFMNCLNGFAAELVTIGIACLHFSYFICLQRKANQSGRRASPKAEEGSGDEGMDVDLDNFMTLDSVGDVDGMI